MEKRLSRASRMVVVRDQGLTPHTACALMTKRHPSRRAIAEMAKRGVSGARNEGSNRSPGHPPPMSGGPISQLRQVAPTSEVSAQSRTSNVAPQPSGRHRFSKCTRSHPPGALALPGQDSQVAPTCARYVTPIASRKSFGSQRGLCPNLAERARCVSRHELMTHLRGCHKTCPEFLAGLDPASPRMGGTTVPD